MATTALKGLEATPRDALLRIVNLVREGDGGGEDGVWYRGRLEGMDLANLCLVRSFAGIALDQISRSVEISFSGRGWLKAIRWADGSMRDVRRLAIRDGRAEETVDVRTWPQRARTRVEYLRQHIVDMPRLHTLVLSFETGGLSTLDSDNLCRLLAYVPSSVHTLQVRADFSCDRLQHILLRAVKHRHANRPLTFRRIDLDITISWGGPLAHFDLDILFTIPTLEDLRIRLDSPNVDARVPVWDGVEIPDNRTSPLRRLTLEGIGAIGAALLIARPLCSQLDDLRILLPPPSLPLFTAPPNQNIDAAQQRALSLLDEPPASLSLRTLTVVNTGREGEMLMCLVWNAHRRFETLNVELAGPGHSGMPLKTANTAVDLLVFTLNRDAIDIVALGELCVWMPSRATESTGSWEAFDARLALLEAECRSREIVVHRCRDDMDVSPSGVPHPSRLRARP